MKLKFTAGLVITILCITSANAQFTGLTAELDTVFFGANTPTPDDPLDPEGLLEFYGTYQVYANFTNPDDALSAIYTDVDALGNPPMYIELPHQLWTLLIRQGFGQDRFWTTNTIPIGLSGWLVAMQLDFYRKVSGSHLPEKMYVPM
jgi:hypothetical protein